MKVHDIKMSPQPRQHRLDDQRAEAIEHAVQEMRSLGLNVELSSLNEGEDEDAWPEAAE